MKIIFLLLVLVGPAAAQTTLNLSEDLVGLGIAASNMVPNTPTLDAGPLFFRAVAYAQNHQINRVIADPGAYYFLSLQYSGAHVAWDSLSNLTIDLQGSDLYFSHSLVNGILITHSTNIVLENFTTDYNPLPFTQVRVVSVNPAQQTIQFVVDGNWQNPSVLKPAIAGPPSGPLGLRVSATRQGVMGTKRDASDLLCVTWVRVSDWPAISTVVVRAAPALAVKPTVMTPGPPAPGPPFTNESVASTW